MAMYLCQELTGSFLRDIAPFFNLKNVGSVSHATFQIRNKKRKNKRFARKIEKIIKLIVSKATLSLSFTFTSLTLTFFFKHHPNPTRIF